MERQFCYTEHLCVQSLNKMKTFSWASYLNDLRRSLGSYAFLDSYFNPFFKNYFLNVYDSEIQIPLQEILFSSLEVK